VLLCEKDGRRCDVELLHSRQWLLERRIAEGGMMRVDLQEQGLFGRGLVLTIDPAPFVPGREGTVYTFVEHKLLPAKARSLAQRMREEPQQLTLEIAPRSRRLVILVLEGEGGHRVDIDLIRNVEWLHEQRAEKGGTVYLDMPEMGARGHARVVAIDPCPPLEDGPGRLVTGKFRHNLGLPGDLKITGESEPLGVTASHLFWSVDRQDWVPVCELKRGERLQTMTGTAIVESYTMRATPEPVYNLEVEVDHCYRVGQQGLLVHNTSEPKTKCKKWNAETMCWQVDPGLPELAPGVEPFEPYAELYNQDTTTEISTAGNKNSFTTGVNGQIVRILQANRNRNGGLVYSDDPKEGKIRLYVGIEEVYEEDFKAGRLVRRGGAWWKRVEDGTYTKIYLKRSALFELQATVDHIRARANGGSNSYCNARVHSRRRGSQKGTSAEDVVKGASE
jgi:hypothetical protein